MRCIGPLHENLIDACPASCRYFVFLAVVSGKSLECRRSGNPYDLGSFYRRGSGKLCIDVFSSLRACHRGGECRLLESVNITLGKSSSCDNTCNLSILSWPNCTHSASVSMPQGRLAATAEVYCQQQFLLRVLMLRLSAALLAARRPTLPCPYFNLQA